jgi:hypothetical protein
VLAKWVRGQSEIGGQSVDVHRIERCDTSEPASERFAGERPGSPGQGLLSFAHTSPVRAALA